MLGQIKSQNLHFQQFHSIFFKQGCFLHSLSAWVHCTRLRPLQPQELLQGACRVQTVSDEALKYLNLLFLLYFIWK